MAAVTPTPGKLPVDFDLVGGPATEPLAEVPTGTLVIVTATITNVRLFPDSRMCLTVADERGESALVGMLTPIFDAASFRAGRDLGVGDTVTLWGTVARRRPTLVTIDGQSIRAA
ncbi:hypothetical protein [Streptomyces malaysiensis]